MPADARGNPCSSSSRLAHEAAEQALWRMMSFYDTPLADLDTAMAADPAWCLPHVMKAGFLASLTEPGLSPEAHFHLQQAQARQAQATPRERAHIAAVQQVLQGHWAQAGQHWDTVLTDHPRDALALQWAHLWDFYTGNTSALRQRPARVLPEWDLNDPLYAHVLSLWAFGLEENNLHGPAEDAGRRALEANPRVPWAIHAVAHVMDDQGRFEEGAAWLRQQQPIWADGNGFAGHLWWHKALFRLEALDFAGVQRLLDAHLCADQTHITLQRLDVASLLWRLHLLEHDVSASARLLVQAWAPDATQAGFYTFNDVHLVLALLAAGDVAQAENWTARCAEQLLKPEDARRYNQQTARQVGLPLMRGLCALARGEHNAAVALMAPVRDVAARMGGSHAQRDLMNLSLLAASAKGSNRNLGRALINERLMSKPETPLTRHWIEQLRITQQELP